MFSADCRLGYGGVHVKAVLWPGIVVLMQISRSRFKQSKIYPLVTHIYVSGYFVNFWVILGRNSFSQRISEIYGNRKNLEDLILF